MLNASYHPYLLHFKSPAGTSRGILKSKETWFIRIWDETNPAITGIGEAAVFRGLSCDDKPDYENMLARACTMVSDEQWLNENLIHWPSILFAFETALLDLKSGGRRILHDTDFTLGLSGIPINGLIWMGTRDEMMAQIYERIRQGFRCLKLKVGAIDFEDEISLLNTIRQEFDAGLLEIRLDANGAFQPDEALAKLERLSHFNIHSIEQPIKAGMREAMSALCLQSPIPIALDEELIVVQDLEEKRSLLDQIRPAYIILKPALHGSFSGCEEWCKLASEHGISWWFTSALESNIGLNAISQYVAAKGYERPQGLGTGSLYSNNIPSPLIVKDSQLWHSRHNEWDLRLTGLL
jgi:o-succinylbenzoate synthase